MADTFLRIKKIRSYGEMECCAEHNLEDDEQNIVLVPMPSWCDYATGFKNRIDEQNITPRKNAVFMVEVYMSFTGVPAKPFQLEAWGQTSVNWLRNIVGKDNLISAVLHIEPTPHVHAMFIPIDSNHRLNCSAFITNRESLLKLQDSYAMEMRQFGLERAKKPFESKLDDMPEQNSNSDANDTKTESHNNDLGPRLAFEAETLSSEDITKTKAIKYALEHPECIPLQLKYEINLEQLKYGINLITGVVKGEISLDVGSNVSQYKESMIFHSDLADKLLSQG